MPAKTREKHVRRILRRLRPRGWIVRQDKEDFIDLGTLTCDLDFNVLAVLGLPNTTLYWDAS